MVYAADWHALIVLTFPMSVKNYNNFSTLGCGTNFERCNEFSKYASVNVYIHLLLHMHSMMIMHMHS